MLLILVKSSIPLYSFNYNVAIFVIIAIFRKIIELKMLIPYTLFSTIFPSNFLTRIQNNMSPVHA